MYYYINSLNEPCNIAELAKCGTPILNESVGALPIANDTADTFFAGATFTVSCADGFGFPPAWSRFITISCLDDGEWSNISGNCQGMSKTFRWSNLNLKRTVPAFSVDK